MLSNQNSKIQFVQFVYIPAIKRINIRKEIKKRQDRMLE